MGSQPLADSIRFQSNAEDDQKVERPVQPCIPNLDDILGDVLVQKLHQILPPLMMVWDLVDKNGVFQGTRQLNGVRDKVFQII